MKKSLSIVLGGVLVAACTRAPSVAPLLSREVSCGVVAPGASIQAALDACVVGGVVQLQAGTYIVDDHLLINKGIVLRGVGRDTILRKTNGAVPGTYQSVEQEPIIVVGPSRWPVQDDSTARNVTVSVAEGASSVIVASVAGFAVGQVVLIDEDHYTTAAWKALPPGASPTRQIWASDKVVWQRHNPAAGWDDPLPGASAWFGRLNRPVAEIKEIASIAGNTLTFTTPLRTSYRVAYKAQVVRWTGGNTHVRGAGVEDLRMQGGSDGSLRFLAAVDCWASGVEVHEWLGEGVAINQSLRVRLQHSYIHDAVWPYPGGGGYAISLANASSEALVEDNVILQTNKVMVARSAGAGSVVAYNYADDGLVGSDLSWQEVGINGSHMVGAHHMLFEGNLSFNYDSDNTHGSAFAHTVFRNHLTGQRRSYPGLSNGRTVGLMAGSYGHRILGNVLGKPGALSGWIFEDLAPWPGPPAVWRLGYDPITWEQDPDPQVAATTVREGNFDYLRGVVDTPAVLPNSLYLSAAPPWWPSCFEWPWVRPEGTTKVFRLPAYERYVGNPVVCPTPTPSPTPTPTPTSTPTPTPTATPSPAVCYLVRVVDGAPVFVPAVCP